jgi:hypothetical protein
LSYHRACEPSPAGGSMSMTVCTNDVALGDLVEDVLPVAIAHALGDAEALVLDVVELEHKRVALAAINAVPLAEEGHKTRRTLCSEGSLAAKRVRDVALTMQRVVRALVLGSAWPAVVVALSTRLTTPSEVGQRLGWPAAPARAHRGGVGGHEHMFPVRSDESCGRSFPIGLAVESGCHGEWRSLVAHPAGGRAVAGSNPVSPIAQA